MNQQTFEKTFDVFRDPKRVLESRLVDGVEWPTGNTLPLLIEGAEVMKKLITTEYGTLKTNEYKKLLAWLITIS